MEKPYDITSSSSMSSHMENAPSLDSGDDSTPTPDPVSPVTPNSDPVRTSPSPSQFYNSSPRFSWMRKEEILFNPLFLLVNLDLLSWAGCYSSTQTRSRHNFLTKSSNGLISPISEKVPLNWNSRPNLPSLIFDLEKQSDCSLKERMNLTSLLDRIIILFEDVLDN